MPRPTTRTRRPLDGGRARVRRGRRPGDTLEGRPTATSVTYPGPGPYFDGPYDSSLPCDLSVSLSPKGVFFPREGRGPHSVSLHRVKKGSDK